VVKALGFGWVGLRSQVTSSFSETDQEWVSVDSSLSFLDRIADAHLLTQHEFTSIGFPLLTPAIDTLYKQLVITHARSAMVREFLHHRRRKRIPYNQMTLEDARALFVKCSEVEDIARDPDIDAILEARLRDCWPKAQAQPQRSAQILVATETTERPQR